jgi:aryl-alcohol dehydrogenase-like predicted oxidoreductase
MITSGGSRRSLTDVIGRRARRPEGPVGGPPSYSGPVETRVLGRTGRQVSVVGLGCWQLGGDWGRMDDEAALDVLRAAVAEGVTLLDTADVYGDGRSERLIGRFLAEGPDAPVMVATKCGRRADPHVREAYTLPNLRAWTDRSRATLGVERLDLVQLHCPPAAVYGSDEVFDALDTLVAEGALAAYGVSVETRAEALAAIARPNVASVQIILNAFRHAPVEDVLPAARAAGVGVIARVPLASGLLSGRYGVTTTFPAEDHRTYNRHGEAFDIGETFSGVPFEVGVAAARELAALAPRGVTAAALALRWVIDQPGVSTVIPGARTPAQARANAAVVRSAPLTPQVLDGVRAIYDERIRPHVHDRW